MQWVFRWMTFQLFFFFFSAAQFNFQRNPFLAFPPGVDPVREDWGDVGGCQVTSFLPHLPRSQRGAWELRCSPRVAEVSSLCILKHRCLHPFLFVLEILVFFPIILEVVKYLLFFFFLVTSSFQSPSPLNLFHLGITSPLFTSCPGVPVVT